MVDEEEIQQVCSMRETILGRVLQDWERKVVSAHLQNEKLKAMNQEERAHVPNFDKVITFMFVRHNLNILMEKVIKSASNRFNALKRRPDFDKNILPARKLAKSGAERVQAVGFKFEFEEIVVNDVDGGDDDGGGVAGEGSAGSRGKGGSTCS